MRWSLGPKLISKLYHLGLSESFPRSISNQIVVTSFSKQVNSLFWSILVILSIGSMKDVFCMIACNGPISVENNSSSCFCVNHSSFASSITSNGCLLGSIQLQYVLVTSIYCCNAGANICQSFFFFASWYALLDDWLILFIFSKKEDESCKFLSRAFLERSTERLSLVESVSCLWNNSNVIFLNESSRRRWWLCFLSALVIANLSWSDVNEPLICLSQETIACVSYQR